MREIFSEENKYKLWRKIWVALAMAQYDAGLITKKELTDLKNNQENIDINQILEHEKKTRHDVVAAIKEFAAKATDGGGKIHLGATSMDIVDNTDAIRTQQALHIVEEKILAILAILTEKIEQYADHVCMGYTHLQPAEPTTVGYRLSVYAQDLLTDYHFLQFVKKEIKAKGMKGAVGTAASYTAVLDRHSGEQSDSRIDSGQARMTAMEMEQNVMNQLGIEPAIISTQVSPRKYDYLVLTLLASISSTFAKFAGDLRLLQSPSIGEWAEPFGKNQVGSSAMPFKRNPINAEKICSLARYVAALPTVALENATLSYLERTLDDSANKRIVMPEAFLATDEILQVGEKLLSGLVINEKKIAFNLAQYAPFAATEAILMESVKQGASRQDMHETLRDISMKAWGEVQEGKPNPMEKLLRENQSILKYLSKEHIISLIEVKHHIGNAPERAKKLVRNIEKLKKGSKL